MKKMALLILVAFTISAKAQLYKSQEGSITFFSKAPLEDIDASSKKIISIINTSSKEIVFGIAIKSFQFRIQKMEDDFNEDFMESDKYPDATYKGKINEEINWEKDGTYRITAKGILTIHGVSNERLDTAMVSIVGGKISLSSDFLIRVSDYKIKIPQLLFEKIAEVVSVQLLINYLPYKKEQ